MNVINEFGVNVSVIPNALEIYMAFIIKENLVFIGSKQFINSSLENLVLNICQKNLILNR